VMIAERHRISASISYLRNIARNPSPKVSPFWRG